MEILSNKKISKLKKYLDSKGIKTDVILNKMVSKRAVLTICGPTGVGKSALGLSLARILGTDIISVDSMQVYKYMKIGTDKMDTEKYGVKQFMTDIFEPGHIVSVVEFKNICRELINKHFFAKHRIPLLVGGSGLYIRGVLYNIDAVPEGNSAIRENIRKKIDKQGIENVYGELVKIDPGYADKISINDKRRIIRALEVYEISGIPFSHYQQSWKINKPYFNNVIIGLDYYRKALYEKIEARVEQMFERGLVEEVKELKKMGFAESYSLMQAVGYKETIDYLEEKSDLEECKDQVKKNTRRLAKKQMTWFRADERINWIRVDNYDNIFDLMLKVLEEVKVNLS